MLALVGFEGTAPRFCQHLDDLPDPPALTWSGFYIHCADPAAVLSRTAWLADLRERRRHAPVGLAWSTEAAVAAEVAAVTLGIKHCHETRTRRPEPDIIAALLSATVESRILDDWFRRWPGAARDDVVRDLLRTIAEGGARGDGLNRISAAAGMDESTVHRKITERGLPTPGKLRTMARVRSVARRRELGLSLRDAVAAAGWLDVESFRKAKARLRKAGL